jgi:methyl-accepting chemotaxis protein
MNDGDGSDAHTEHRAVQGRVCLDALPIWAKQVETARLQTEEAVVALSARFSGIVDRLDSALGTQGSDSSAQIIAAEAEEGARHLAQVMDALRTIQESRNALAQEIRALVVYTNELQSMSADVEKIAFQTNMLSLNAAIEAAHAGDSGRGFAVIAQAVRTLSATARDTSKRISKKAQMINSALIETGLQNERVSSEDKQAVEASEVSIRTVLDSFRERTQRLSQIAQQSGQESKVIKDAICESLVQLQFQDRVGQILSQLAKSMTDLNELPSDDDSGISVQDRVRNRIEHMASSYTTDEQRRIHQGLAAETAVPQEITFF